MSGFLHRLAARSLGQEAGLQPRRASLFEGAAPLMDAAVEAPVGGPATMGGPRPADAIEVRTPDPRNPVSQTTPTHPTPSLPSVARSLSPNPPLRTEVREVREIHLHDSRPREIQAPPQALPVKPASPPPMALAPMPALATQEVRVERILRDGAPPALVAPPAAGPRSLPVMNAARPKPAAPPSVQVTIGRVEIRAGGAPERKPRATEAPQAGAGLEAYLHARRGR